jgi:hypothetical protein
MELRYGVVLNITVANEVSTINYTLREGQYYFLML